MISFDASGSHDPDGTITSYAWDFGDGTTRTGVTVSHAYSTAGSFTVTLTVTDNGGLTDQSTAVKVITSPTGVKVRLTFKVFNADDFENGVGQLDVRVNGNLVVNVPAGLFHLAGSGDYQPYEDEWVLLGPFDISSFVLQGTNTIVLSDPLSGHVARVRDITIVSGGRTLLNFTKTRNISPTRSLTLSFSFNTSPTLSHHAVSARLLDEPETSNYEGGDKETVLTLRQRQTLST